MLTLYEFIHYKYNLQIYLDLNLEFDWHNIIFFFSYRFAIGWLGLHKHNWRIHVHCNILFIFNYLFFYVRRESEESEDDTLTLEELKKTKEWQSFMKAVVAKYGRKS